MMRLILALISMLAVIGGSGCAKGYFRGSSPSDSIELRVVGYEIWNQKICQTINECDEDISKKTVVKIAQEDEWFRPFMAYQPQSQSYVFDFGITEFRSHEMVCLISSRYHKMSYSNRRELNLSNCEFGLMFDGDIRNLTKEELENIRVEGHWAKLMAKWRYIEGTYSQELEGEPLRIEERNVKWIIKTLSGVIESDTQK